MWIKEFCNKCGKEIDWDNRWRVTCKYTELFEHDTERFLCSEYYKKFSKYAEKHYYKFFTYLNDMTYPNGIER